MFGFDWPELLFIFAILIFYALIIALVVYMITREYRRNDRKESSMESDKGITGNLGDKAMTQDELRQQVRDEEHLKLLSLGYKVSAGITAVYSLFGLFYSFIGLMVMSGNFESSDDDQALAFIGGMFIFIGLFIVSLGFTFAALKWHTANLIKKRRSLLFCQVIAAISCLGLPYGTLLGVATFMVLARPTVAKMFQEGNNPAAMD